MVDVTTGTGYNATETPVSNIYRQEMQRLRTEFGNLTLGEYITRHLLRHREFKPVDEDVYRQFRRNVGDSTIVSTGGHLCLLSWDFPIQFGENVISNVYYALGEATTPIPMLSTSKIPFSNLSKPGFVMFQGPNGHIRSYSFVGSSKKLVMYGAPMNESSLSLFSEQLDKRLKYFPIEEASAARLDAFKSRLSIAIKSQNTFAKQAEFLSSSMWPYIFDDDLIAHHASPPLFKATETAITSPESLLCNKRTRSELEKLFSGVWGAWDTKSNGGTYFYYGSCRCGREFTLVKEEMFGRVRLSGRCSMYLEDGDRGAHSDLCIDVDEIPNALAKGEIHEGLLMLLYKIWILAGINVMGGFNQIEYLAEFKHRFVELFDRVGEKGKAKTTSERPTNLFNTGLAIMFDRAGAPVYGSKAMLDGGMNEAYLRNLLDINFGHLIDASKHIMDSVLSTKKPDNARLMDAIKSHGLASLLR